jgi:hypothetical protein
LQQEELMGEMNLEKNDEQDHLYKREEYFQDIFYEASVGYMLYSLHVCVWARQI